jgi:hypothetical protein
MDGNIAVFPVHIVFLLIYPIGNLRGPPCWRLVLPYFGYFIIGQAGLQG